MQITHSNTLQKEATEIKGILGLTSDPVVLTYPISQSNARISVTIKNANGSDHSILAMTPQLFIDKENSNITYHYQSDYKLLPQIYLNEQGITLHGITKGVNVDSTNLLLSSGQTEKHIGEVKTPKEINYNNSFCNDKAFTLVQTGGLYNIDFTAPIILTRGFYVFKINMNFDGIKNSNPDENDSLLKLEINNDKTSNFYFINQSDFIVFYINTDAWALNKLCLVTSTVPTNTYIRNVGLYKVNYDCDAKSQNDTGTADLTSKTSITTFEDYLKNFLQELIVSCLDNRISIADKYIEDSIIFPVICCFKEVMNKEKPQIGCLETKFDGFQYLPVDCRYRCCGIYGLEKGFYLNASLLEKIRYLKAVLLNHMKFCSEDIIDKTILKNKVIRQLTSE